MMTKTISYRKQYRDAMRLGIRECPSFHKSGSITGMRKKFYGKNALLVRFGQWIYNVSAKPDIYAIAK